MEFKHKFAVFQEDFGTAGFYNKSLACELYNKLDGKKILYEIEESGNMNVMREEKTIEGAKHARPRIF